MAQRNQPRQPGRPAEPARHRAAPAEGAEASWNPFPGGRETIESIVVAFTLALLFRAFEAEAFVIPTGSMAPTLMGRHKDLACDACGRDFRVGCSQEEDEQSQSLRTELARLERELADMRRVADSDATPPRDREAARRRAEMLEAARGPIAELRIRLAGKMVPAARCPNCGNVISLMNRDVPAPAYDRRYPSFSGDRILVDKFGFDVGGPRRWDVVVFRYPEEAKTNYIKRLVGLPNETVCIARGDIWTIPDGGTAAIARKPPATMRAMLQCVHDSRHVAPALHAAGWPLSWSEAAAAEDGRSRWATGDQGRSWGVSCAAGESATLRYRHLLPTAEDWELVRSGRSVADRARPARIDDFQPYNAIATRPHTVGDLAVECTLEAAGSEGEVEFDLVEDGAAHRCTLDLATGEARLRVAGTPPADAVTTRTPIRGRGRWTILFANVDDELSLFVDGRLMTPDGPTAWAAPMPEGGAVPTAREAGPDAADDLAPVGITCRGGAVTIRGLRVLRDIYYITAVDVARNGQIIEEDILRFPLGPDQFLVLGDNSAASKDSRLWLEGHHVDRRLLIGRALVIFWPHAIPAPWHVTVPLFGGEVRLPSWPNFARMRFVR